jgi:hypothetical protein
MVATIALLAGCADPAPAPRSDAARPTRLYLGALSTLGHGCVEVDAYSATCIGN